MLSPLQHAYHKSRRVLTPQQIAEIQRLWKLPLPDRPTQLALAQRFNVSKYTIFRAVNNVYDS